MNTYYLMHPDFNRTLYKIEIYGELFKRTGTQNERLIKLFCKLLFINEEQLDWEGQESFVNKGYVESGYRVVPFNIRELIPMVTV